MHLKIFGLCDIVITRGVSMTTADKWNLIVSNVQKKYMAKENEVQNLWEALFADTNFFGYSKFSGEIDSQHHLHIGVSGQPRPDIIIKDIINNRNLFVIELKQHNLPYDTKYKEQLFSYMLLLELKVGILICDKIHIFYREKYGVEYSLVIPFTNNNSNGIRFIELFSKGNFNQEDIKNFIVSIEKTKENINQIKADLQQLDINELLIEHYSQKYSLEEVNEALKNLHISIGFENEVQSVQPMLTVTSSPHPTFKTNKKSEEDGGIGKSKAKKIFEGLGYKIPKNTSYASKNRAADCYWSNPPAFAINSDWYLILDDWKSKILYLFQIPRNAIMPSQLKYRDNGKIDLRIKYKDPTFADWSNTRFDRYLKKECKY